MAIRSSPSDSNVIHIAHSTSYENAELITNDSDADKIQFSNITLSNDNITLIDRSHHAVEIVVAMYKSSTFGNDQRNLPSPAYGGGGYIARAGRGSFEFCSTLTNNAGETEPVGITFYGSDYATQDPKPCYCKGSSCK